MRDRTDHQLRGLARQYRVRIECNHITNELGATGVADDGAERVLRVAAEILVELRELSSLALPAHPHVLLRIPQSRPMEEEEHIFIAGSVLRVEGLDAG